MLDISAKRDELDAVDRKALREVMVEERHRYCAFVHMLQPVVQEECDIMYELGHLREAMDSIGPCTKDPNTLPELSETMILELRAPPSASVIYADPLLMGVSQTRCSISTGSRKSSVGSINSLHSSDSRECPTAPGQYQRSVSQVRFERRNVCVGCAFRSSVVRWCILMIYCFQIAFCLF